MILCFSGTGNSQHTAKIIAGITGDEIVSVNEKLKSGDYSPVAGKDLVFCVPTYAWRIPRAVEEWIRNTAFPDAERAWFVMTCGSETGNAGGYNSALCNALGIGYMGTAEIVMPENFITMFSAPEKEEAERIISKADSAMMDYAGMIKDGSAFLDPKPSLLGYFESRVINPVFYRTSVKADGYYAKDACNSCGKCARLCPLNNIDIKDGRPVWGRNCTQCMACIAHCPVEAIEYGNKTKGKTRYYLD